MNESLEEIINKPHTPLSQLSLFYASFGGLVSAFIWAIIPLNIRHIFVSFIFVFRCIYLSAHSFILVHLSFSIIITIFPCCSLLSSSTIDLKLFGGLEALVFPLTFFLKSVQFV